MALGPLDVVADDNPIVDETVVDAGEITLDSWRGVQTA